MQINYSKRKNNKWARRRHKRIRKDLIHAAGCVFKQYVKVVTYEWPECPIISAALENGFSEEYIRYVISVPRSLRKYMGRYILPSILISDREVRDRLGVK